MASDYGKKLKEWTRLERRSGWTVEQTGGNHMRFTPPAGRFIICSLSPSDHRAMLKVRCVLRRAGLGI